MSNTAPIFIVDDDPAVRDALRLLIESAGHTAVTCSSGDEYLEKCTGNCATCTLRIKGLTVTGRSAFQCEGCVIIDLDMPGKSGVMVQQELVRRGWHLPVIFLTGKATVPTAVEVLKNGAMDFLTKPVDSAVLLEQVTVALRLSSESRRKSDEFVAIQRRVSTLTEREREIMQLVVQGCASKTIAKRLGISPRTVDIHRGKIAQKTNVHNLVELSRIAAILWPPG